MSTMETNNGEKAGRDFRNVPKGYQLCFNKECPKKDECLRFMVGCAIPDDRDWGPAIYPNIKIGEEGCRLFATGEPQRMAWGFETLFEEVKSKHERGLRLAMYQYLNGSSNYYRYHHGEKLLNAEQQQWIIQLFQRTGYTENLKFDHYTHVFDFWK